MKKRISIITVNYNGLKDTCALIDSIPFNEHMEVIVVDNASQKDEGAIIKERYPHVKVIQSLKNLGFAGGNNLGIKASTGDYLFFINNDTELHPEDWNPEALIKRIESSERIGVVCPKIRFAWDSHPIQFAGYTPLSSITLRNHSIGFGEEDRGQHDLAHPTPYAHGAAMMVKRDVIEKAGMMPECFFLYYEELDWSLMISRAGYEIWYEPACTIYHKESQATGQNSPLKTFYLMRNRLLLAKRNIPIMTRLLTYSYLIGIVGTKDIITNIIKGCPLQAKATLRGIIDFLKL
ncbi:glycosyltransferase family 2 protein [Xylanibacter brevis]|uniref:glycosyltransferase family 2 protein n=1 Tax=Xylanibacter brevis TaxID=83231 RepID=UPI0004883ADE|nr:glycosyltransferase family 2 protein [Xylanibacter brevis]